VGPAGGGRGQTTLDFAIGVSVFVVVMVFVFAFVPGILVPFTDAEEDHTVSVGRYADTLAGDLLGAPGEPFVLDRPCTVQFFASDSGSGCRFADGGLAERLHNASTTRVNVTVLGNVTAGDHGNEILCWDDGADELLERDDAACSVGTEALARGETPTDDAATITARRVVLLAEEDVTLRVVVW